MQPITNEEKQAAALDRAISSVREFITYSQYGSSCAVPGEADYVLECLLDVKSLYRGE